MFYDNYGLFAIGSFDSIPYNESVTYKVSIYKKNYDNPFADPDNDTPGNAKSLTFGSDPMILRTLNDDAFGIKGSEVELTLLNIDNQTPLSLFYSEEDDTYKIWVKAIYGGGVITRNIFQGFLVQEDSSEVLTDFAHEIKLSFTDGLGTLKYVSFGEAAKWSPKSTTDLRVVSLSATLVGETTTTSPFLRLNSNQNVGSPSIGDYVVFMNSPIGYAAHQIKLVFTNPLSATDKRLYFTDTVRTYGPATTKVAYVTGSDPLTRIKLADVIRICLHACNLNLDVYFGNSVSVIKESTEYTDILNNVYIDGRTFLQDENNWKDCYEVLNEIMVRFQCSIFQAEGRWYIVRWNELRNHNNQIPFKRYDGYLTYIENVYYFKQDIEKVETGFDQTFLRPYNFYRDTFNYTINNNFLKNRTSQKLGLKLNSYLDTIDGNQVTVYEYEWDEWTGNATPSGAIYKPFIKIVKDNLNQEIDRYSGSKLVSGVPTKTNNDSSYAIEAKKIECKKGDSIKFSFDIKNIKNGINQISYIFKLTDGTTTYYLNYSKNQNDKFEWKMTGAFDGPLGSWGVNTNFKTIEADCEPFPIDGLLTFYLPYFDFPSSNPILETIYKNISFEYIPFINQLTIVKSHEHTATQNQILKNNQSTEIYVDDTQKNSLNGTLFFNAFSNLIQVRTSQWRDGQILGNWPLGDIMTRQMEDWRYKIRLKLEGKVLGIINSVGDFMMLYRAVYFDIKADKYFIFGKVTYNFKEDYIDCTLYEMWDTTESRAGTGIAGNDKITYDFKYLYK